MDQVKHSEIGARQSAELLLLMMSALDFRHALSAATFLMYDCDWSVRCSMEELRRLKCYETTMVVAYARPFAQARGKSAPFRWSLLGNNFSLDDSEKRIHNSLIEFRNKLYAHSDSDFTRIVPEIWRTHLPDGEDFDFLTIHGGESLNFLEEEVQAIHKFLWKVRHHLDKAVQNHPAPRGGIPIRDMGGFGDPDI